MKRKIIATVIAGTMLSLSACGDHTPAQDATPVPTEAAASAPVASPSAPVNEKVVEAVEAEMDKRVEEVKALNWLGESGLSATVRVKFNSDGSLVSAEIVKSSGNPEYDAYAVAIYKAAMSKPLVIDGMQSGWQFDNTLTINVPRGDAPASFANAASAPANATPIADAASDADTQDKLQQETREECDGIAKSHIQFTSDRDAGVPIEIEIQRYAHGDNFTQSIIQTDYDFMTVQQAHDMLTDCAKFHDAPAWGVPDAPAGDNSVSDQCQKLNSTEAVEHGVDYPHSRQAMNIVGKGAVQIYSAPIAGCEISGATIPAGTRDRVNAVVAYKGFASIIYFPEHGDPIEGWIDARRIAFAQYRSGLVN